MKKLLTILLVASCFRSEAQTVTLYPTGVGTYSEITSLVGDTPAWKCVDESSADDATTQIYVGPDYLQKSTFTHTASGLTSETISKIVYTFRVRADAPGYSCSPVLYIGGTAYYPSSYSFPDGSWHTVSYDYTTNPNTSAAWTVANIASLEFGVRLGANDEYGYHQYCTQCYITVNYSSGGSTSKPRKALLGVGK